MEIKDLAGLSEPISKLIEVCSNGISAIAEPWKYKRLERAKLQIEQESATLRRNIHLQDVLSNQLETDVLNGRDLREWKNVIDVIGVSEKNTSSKT